MNTIFLEQPSVKVFLDALEKQLASSNGTEALTAFGVLLETLKWHKECSPEDILRVCDDWEYFFYNQCSQQEEARLRFVEYWGRNPEPFFAKLLEELTHYPHHETCRLRSIKYLMTLAQFEEDREEDDSRLNLFIPILHYYSKAIEWAEGLPDECQKLRECISRVLVKVVWSSFANQLQQALHEDMNSEPPNLNHVVECLNSILELRNEPWVFHVPDMLCLFQTWLERSNIPLLDHEKANLLLSIQDILNTMESPETFTTSFIEQIRSEWRRFREDFEQAFELFSHDSGQIPDPQQVSRFQQTIFDEFKALFEKTLWRGGLGRLASARLPGYDFRAGGSVGRREICPYSDLEGFVLVEPGRQPRQQLLHHVALLQFALIALGETPDVDVPRLSSQLSSKGLYLDPNPDPEGDCVIPVGDAQRLATIQRPMVDEDNLEKYTLLRSTSLSTNNPSLYEPYANTVEGYKIQEVPATHVRAQRFIGELVQTYAQRFARRRTLVNLKHDYMVPLVYLIEHLGILFDVPHSNTLEVIDALTPRCWDESSALLLKEAVSALYLMRLRLHFAYRRACDEASFTATDLQMKPLLKAEKAWLSRIDRLILKPLYACLARGQTTGIDLFNQFRKASLDAVQSEAEATELVEPCREYALYLMQKGEVEQVEAFYRELFQRDCLESLRAAFRGTAIREAILQAPTKRVLHLITLLAQERMPSDLMDGNGDTLSYVTAADPDVLKWLIERKGNAVLAQLVSPPTNKTLALQAARNGHWSVILQCQERAILELQDLDGYSLIHEAARQGQSEAFRYLIACGIDPLTLTKKQEHCLHILAEEGHVELFQDLLEFIRPRSDFKAALEQPNAEGKRPLHLALLRKYKPAIVQLLVGAGADVNACEEATGYTPLHYAAGRGRTDAAQLLLENGADPHQEDNELFNTPVDVAIQFRHYDTARRIMPGNCYAQWLIEQEAQRSPLISKKREIVQGQNGFYANSHTNIFERNEIFLLEEHGEHQLGRNRYYPAAWLFELALFFARLSSKDEQLQQFYQRYEHLLISRLSNVQEAFCEQELKRSMPIDRRSELPLHRFQLDTIKDIVRRDLMDSSGKLITMKIGKELSLNDIKSIVHYVERVGLTEQKVAKASHKLLKNLIESAIAILGEPPCHFAVLVDEPVHRLCCRIQLRIVTEKEINKVENPYFKNLDELLNLKIFLLGQDEYWMQFPRQRPDAVGLYLENTRGFNSTRERRISCMVPSKTELESDEQMLKACVFLTTSQLVGGSAEAKRVVESYSQNLVTHGKMSGAFGSRRRQACALKYLRACRQRNSEQQEAYRDVYRPFEDLLIGMAMFHGLRYTSALDMIRQLKEKRAFADATAEKLTQAVRVAIAFTFMRQLESDGEPDLVRPEDNDWVNPIYEVQDEFHRQVQGFVKINE